MTGSRRTASTPKLLDGVLQSACDVAERGVGLATGVSLLSFTTVRSMS
jgi:hypothetical protein